MALIAVEQFTNGDSTIGLAYPLYYGFISYLYGNLRSFFLCRFNFTNLSTFSLQSRGGKFGDGSTYITVSLLRPCPSFQ